MDEFQINLAKQAGKVPNDLTSKTYENWDEEYEYHINTVKKPLGFALFKSKFIRLSQLFDSDPNGANRSLDRVICDLCNELGY